MKRKLLSKRGETLVEVMVSLVIVILIISMLPMALETAARINARVKDIDTICSRTMADSTKTTVSVSIPQRVSDDAPGMVLENPENLCPACFLLPEKYEIPEVRDYYNMLISHMVQELDVPLHRVSNREELERLTSMYQVTHLFIGGEEYEENET